MTLYVYIFNITTMDQRALQVLSIYRWLCIKGPTKPYGHFIVKEVYKCPINFASPVKYVHNVSDTLILFLKNGFGIQSVPADIYYWVF